MKTDWIPITEDNIPGNWRIVEWKHPEYGVIEGFVYKDNDLLPLSQQAYWVASHDGNSADIWLGEFTHFRYLAALNQNQ